MKRLCHLVLVGFVTLGIAGGASAIPQLINYQGYLTDDLGTPVADGDYSLTFRIWDAETGGTQLWSEDHPTVSVTNGLFNMILGGVSPLLLSFDIDYWLGIEVQSEPELPRIRLTSVAYSYRSSMSDSASHAVWADTATYALDAPRDDDWLPDTSGFHIYRPTGNVGIGMVSLESKLGVDGTGEMTGFKMPTGASDGYVLTSDVSGVGTWQAGSASDNWVLTGSVLHPAGEYGLSMRQSNVLHGIHDSTHVNFGIACTTGASGWDYRHCTVSGGGYNTVVGACGTVSGGYSNRAFANYSTVGGGEENSADGQWSSIGGGQANRSSSNYANVSGGRLCTASGECAAVSGGYHNAASGYYAAVGGGHADTAAGDCSFAIGDSVRITADADYTFAFGRGFTTSTPNAAVFHNSVDGISVGIGIPSPTHALDVQKNAFGEFVVKIRNSNGSTSHGLLIQTASATSSAEVLRVEGHNGSVLGLLVKNDGNVGIGTPDPTAILDVNGSTGYDQVRMRTSYTPTGTGDANGSVGDLAWDDDYMYVKTSGGWKRAALSTW